ncbi:hypothetical protein C8R46DRAFT_1040599 [Mycena filopes]|nr:hypothetical protein C8R46DRAFT_1040599 [Mycena filopes]
MPRIQPANSGHQPSRDKDTPTIVIAHDIVVIALVTKVTTDFEFNHSTRTVPSSPYLNGTRGTAVVVLKLVLVGAVYARASGDEEVTEMKTALGDFDFLADDGNWGIDAYCRVLLMATQYFTTQE